MWWRAHQLKFPNRRRHRNQTSEPSLADSPTKCIQHQLGGRTRVTSQNSSHQGSCVDDDVRAAKRHSDSWGVGGRLGIQQQLDRCSFGMQAGLDEWRAGISNSGRVWINSSLQQQMHDDKDVL